MSTCRDCYHFEACMTLSKTNKEYGALSKCHLFKDKTKIVELPCVIGEVVYTLEYEDNEPYDCSGWILLMANNDFALLSSIIDDEEEPTELCNIYHQNYIENGFSGDNCVGCTIVPISDLYFSKEAAEKALQEKQNE